MRINLQCPFHEKDRVKQLGAKWDPRLRVWFVQDVADLGPFAAWIPRTGRAEAPAPFVAGAPASTKTPSGTRPAGQHAAATTGPVLVCQACSCDVLPWEHCGCTRAIADTPVA